MYKKRINFHENWWIVEILNMRENKLGLSQNMEILIFQHSLNSVYLKTNFFAKELVSNSHILSNTFILGHNFTIHEERQLVLSGLIANEWDCLNFIDKLRDNLNIH